MLKKGAIQLTQKVKAALWVKLPEAHGYLLTNKLEPS